MAYIYRGGPSTNWRLFPVLTLAVRAYQQIEKDDPSAARAFRDELCGVLHSPMFDKLASG